MNLIQINVINELFNERNNNISEITIKYWINCLGLIYNNKIEIKSLELYENTIKDLEKKYNIKLENITMEECKGISDKEIVEKAAICINLCIIPKFYDYKNIEVIQVKDGADYICYGDSYNYIFESKGVNSKYNCPSQAKKASSQLNKSFKIFMAKNLQFGIAGVSCFYNSTQYLIRIQN